MDQVEMGAKDRELWRSVQRRTCGSGKRSTAEARRSGEGSYCASKPSKTFNVCGLVSYWRSRMILNEGGYVMNRARIYILAALTIIWASVLSPTRATAAHRGSDATNLHQDDHAI